MIFVSLNDVLDELQQLKIIKWSEINAISE
jgi:hypothetical protein